MRAAWICRIMAEAIIEADPVQHVSVDGDVWGETPVLVRVLPQAVRFVVGGMSEVL